MDFRKVNAAARFARIAASHGLVMASLALREPIGNKGITWTHDDVSEWTDAYILQTYPR